MSTTVLIVDDDPALRTSLAGAFADEGFDVRTAEDGLEALILQHQRPADVILSDVNMPLVDGYDLTAELRERGDQTPVVLMSAGVLTTCDLPNVSYLHKPFDLDTVLSAVTGMFVVPAVVAALAPPKHTPAARGKRR